MLGGPFDAAFEVRLPEIAATDEGDPRSRFAREDDGGLGMRATLVRVRRSKRVKPWLQAFSQHVIAF